MTLPEKISLRLGDLRPAVEAHLAQTAETPSEYVRRLIADDLGVEAPAMDGHWQNLKPFAKPKKRRK